jgi:membrane protein
MLSLMIPYMLAILAFTLTYLFIPNTSVRVSSALIGGVAAGVLWNVTGKLFATFVLTSTQYTAIYSGFAIALLFMIWLYLSWFITLVGASIGFYVQHPEYLIGNNREITLSNRMKERLSLALVVLIARRYYRDLPACTAQDLTKTLTVPSVVVEELLDVFVDYGLLSRTDAEPSAYLPVRPLEHTTVKQVLDVVRHANENPGIEKHARVMTLDIEGIVTDLETAIDTALQEAVGGHTLKDIALPESHIEQARNKSSARAGSATKPAPQSEASTPDAVREDGS